MNDNERNAAWCRKLIDTLNVGGVWGIPRSGLTFTKTAEDALTLTELMPHDPAMPITAAELFEIQEAEYEVNRAQFALVGVTVTKGNVITGIAGERADGEHRDRATKEDA